MTSSVALRNVAIVVALAAVVWLVPGGGDGADLVSQALNAIFIVLVALFLGRMYQQYRAEIFALGDRWRAVLYLAVGTAVVTIAASGRLFETGPGALAWFALVGGASYALYLVYKQHRSYSF